MKTFYVLTRNAWRAKHYVIVARGISEAQKTAAVYAHCDGSRYAYIWSTNGAHLSTIQAGENGRCYIPVYTPDEMRVNLTAEERATW